MSIPRRPLGRTGIEVSQLCLGTMTWGTQNTYEEAAAQIEMSLDHGVNFIDTAEMYPTTPLTAETQGHTEAIIGRWFANTGRRSEIVLATKVMGNGRKDLNGGHDISGDSIRHAVEGSLKRLQSDVIDLYQLHWPNRGSYHFRQNWSFDATGQAKGRMRDEVCDILRACDELIKAGKIRSVGLSNESAWGVCQFLAVAESEGLPRVASIQNEYNLMNRLFDLDLAEVAHHEDVGLLAFSPLGAGQLSGKYDGGEIPAGSRRTLNENLSGRYTALSLPALEAYIAVARQHELDPAQMALAFCLQRPFMSSVIIGATRPEQLLSNLQASELVLSDDVLADIATVHRRYPVPM